MTRLHIICPVKDAIDTTLKALENILNSSLEVSMEFFVYNDFSLKENTEKLLEYAELKGFTLINLEEITTNPSPNYLLVLQMAQKNALKANAHLLVVESDVMVKNDTIQQMLLQTELLDNPGMIAAVTTDESGIVNFPYLYAKKYKPGVINTSKRLSFCCTLLTNSFLQTYDFCLLNPEKDWYDIFISHQSKSLGFNNYLLTNLPVLHIPHSSRPWKKLKYSNPLLYYWRKYTRQSDRI
jgi:hypothetical protein